VRRDGVKCKSALNVAHRTDRYLAVVYNAVMPRLPNQIDEPTYLLEQIEKCRRLAREVRDQATVERLLTLAGEYEQRLKIPQRN
jgi:hypothetical protein